MSDSGIDENAIKALQELGGGSFVIQMIDIFMDYVPKLIAEGRDGLAKGNLEPVVRMGHSLRSSGRNVGAIKLVELAQRVESAGRAGHLSELSALIDQVEQAFIQAKDCLEKHKGALGDVMPTVS